MSNPRERHEEQRREALRTLDTLRESDTVATSALARTARRASDHFTARDAMHDALGADGSVDSVELWGRRIGRALSFIGLIALAVYLYVTYFSKRRWTQTIRSAGAAPPRPRSPNSRYWPSRRSAACPITSAPCAPTL